MNLMITGAFVPSEEQLDKIKKTGFDVAFLPDERGKIPFDVSEFDAVICNGLFLYHDIKDFKELKFIQLTSAGFDRVPLEYINEKGIEIHNARGVYSIPMAEFALAGVLSLYKHLNSFREKQAARVWEKDRLLRELCGETVLTVGAGSVGTECAKRFKTFGTEVIAADIAEPESEFYDEYFNIKEIKAALGRADIVVLTLPLTDETRGMLRKELFDRFKRDSVLVNISRGAVVNESDLISALGSGKLSGAVLDVFETEPIEEENPLWKMENVIITPHNSFVSKNNSGRLFRLIANNLREFAGKNNG